MNGRAILAIIRKDLKVVSQNKGVSIPILMVPLILFVAFPWAIKLVPSLVGIAGVSANDMDQVMGLINRLPLGEFVGYTNDQKIIVYFLVYLLAPLFLIVPLMVSSVIAADSFAGEKERKTMEALLYTPTTDRELFIGKLLSGWLAALAVALGSFLLYVVNVNSVGWSEMHRIFFPNTMWLVMILWVVPALPGLALGVMVLVSSRAQGFQDANQLGGLVVMPVVLLLVGQISGAMALSVTFMFLLGLVFWILAGLLIYLGSRSFRRGRLLGA